MNLGAVLFFVLASFIVGFIIGTVRGYDQGAADQARQDAIVSKEGREHLNRLMEDANKHGK